MHDVYQEWNSETPLGGPVVKTPVHHVWVQSLVRELRSHVSARVYGQWQSRVWLFGKNMDCSLPGSSIHGILQARTLEWVAISYSGGNFST